MDIGKVTIERDEQGNASLVLHDFRISIMDDPEMYEIYTMHGEEKAIAYAKSCLIRGVKIMMVAEEMELDTHKLTAKQIMVIGDALRFRGEINE